MEEQLPIAEDIEMSDNSVAMVSDENLMQIDDRKRICTERSSSEETMSLSQVSNALDNSSNSSSSVSVGKRLENLTGIHNFKPTQLEIIEEGEFIWEFDNFNEKFNESPIFVIGGTPWKIKSSITDKASGGKYFGLHLEVADVSKRNNKNWAVCAEFILGIFNPNPEDVTAATPAVASPAAKTGPSLSNMFSPLRSSSSLKIAPKEQKEAINGHSNYVFHRFSSEAADWGFGQFCSFNAFKSGVPETGVIPLANSEGSTRIIAKVRVVKDSTGVLWHNFTNYDSKATTGFVGLLNQGATCYMNSFVQSIFLTNEFRSAVYKIPTENVSPTSSIPLALQRIFYKLETSQFPPSTTEMTKSFGWDTAESFMQHDVQEFSRVLMDDLENKMKGTEVEGTVERLFRGKLKNVLKCTQVDYESVREEFFYDLQLTIKGYKDLKESFERYVAAEMLCGDNQYRTDDFGLQDAKKFVTFEHFPPVLHIHLERYAFDMMAEATVKIHDRFEFPSEIALDPYLSETSPDRNNPQDYWLHSVLVHAGDGHGGHYFVYIRHPSKPDCWYKFDDTKVTPCTEREALDENFGGYEAVSSEEAMELQRSTGVRPYRYKKFTSAYLLVYIRKSELDTVMAPIEESSIPEYLVARIKSDDMAEARRRHERQQQYLNMDVTIVTDLSIRNYAGSDIFDPEANENVFKIKRDLAIQEICDEMLNNLSKEDSEYSGCDGVECYTLSGRRNKTIRTDAIIEDLESRTIGSLSSKLSTAAPSIYLRLIDSSAELSGDLWRQPLNADRILIFFKWYDPVNDKLIILGSMPIERDQSISSVEPLIKIKLKQLDIESDVEFSYYEEFKPSKIISIDVESGKSFKEADLRNGDIILIEPKNQVRTVIDYFSDLLSWRQVDIKPVNPHQNQAAVFENVKISTKWKLSDVCKFIGNLLEIDWKHLRIVFASDSNCVSSGGGFDVELITEDTSSNNNNNKNNNYPQFLKTNNEGNVKDFLIGTSSIDIITIKYEITEEPAEKAENQVRYFVESSNLEILLPNAIYLTPYVSTVGDLIKKVTGSDEKLMKFRLLQVINGKIKTTFSVGGTNESLTPIEPEKCSLYLEEIVDDGNSKLMSCFTFEKNPSKPFGIPFKFEIKPEETVKMLKTRLAQKLTIPSPDTLNIFLFSGSRDRKLEDADEILFNLPGGKFGDEDQLAIMMIDPRKIRSNSGFDGAIRFRK